MEFCGGKVKVLEGKFSKNNMSINKHLAIDIPIDIYFDGIIYSFEQLSYLISNNLKQYAILARDIIVVINSSYIITREITMPRVSHEEINAILEYQINNYIPIDPEEYIVQYLVTDIFFEDGVERIKLLLISIPKTMIEAHLNLVKNMNLNPKILDYQGNSTAKILNYNNKINDEYLIDNKTIAVIDLSYDITKLTIIKSGKLKISRVLEHGLLNIVENISTSLNIEVKEVEKVLHNLEKDNTEDMVTSLVYSNLSIHIIEMLEEIEIIFRYYLNENQSASIDLILLQGEFNKINKIEIIFQEFLNIKSIKLNTLDNIKFNGELSNYSNLIGSIIRREEVAL